MVTSGLVQTVEAKDESGTFAVLALVQSTLIFTIALIMIPLPKIGVEFALDAAQILRLQVAYGLPFSGLLLLGGRLADRFGGRRILLVGLLLFGASAVVAGLAPGYPLLLAARFCQGVSAALVAPAAMAILRILFSDPQRFGQAMATWGGVSVLGAVVGFVASGVLTTWVSWRWMFAVPVMVSCLGLVTAWRLRPAASDAADRPQLDLAGAGLVTAGIVTGSLGLVASHENPWSSLEVAGPLCAGAALLMAFLALEGQVRDPLLPPRFLFQRRRAIGLLGMLLAAAGSVLIEYVLLFYLQGERRWSSLMTAVSFLPFVACLIASNRIAPGLVGRMGAVKVAAAGLLAAAVGLAVLAFLDGGTSYATIAVAQVLVALGVSWLFSGAAVLSTADVAEHQGGLAGGVMNTAMELGPTIGLAALMSVAATQADAVRGYGAAFGAAAFAYVALAVAAGALGRGGGAAR